MIRKLPSGRWKANYTGPDTAIHKAPHTFDTRMDAEGWLASQRRAIDLNTWAPPGATLQETALARTGTFADYAETWLEHRVLKPRMRAHYQRLLTGRLHRTSPAAPASP
jgi:hypothetical protein